MPDMTLKDNPSIDSGWAWLVALGIALWNLVISGTIKSAGILYVEYLALYNDSLSTTSWIGASFTLTLFVFAPLSGFLRDNTSHNMSRVTVAVATCIAAAGIFATAWAQNAYQAIITFGLITGSAAAIMDAPILMCVGLYFKKRRFLANSIAFSGSSVGGFVVPIILNESIAALGVRGALMILAGIWLHVLIVVCIMRPPDRQPMQEHTKENAEINLPSDLTKSSTESEQERQQSYNEHEHHLDELEACDKKAAVDLDVKSSQRQLSLQSVTENQKIQGNQIWQVLSDYKEFLCAPGLPLLSITFIINSVAFYTQFFLLPPLIVANSLSKSFAATVISICSIIELFCRVIIGYMVDKYPNKKTLLLSVSYLLTAVFGFTLSFMVSVPLLIIYSLVLGVFGGLFSPLMVPMLMKRVPENHMGSASGLYAFLTGFGSTIGPPIISLIKEKHGAYNFGLVFLSSCYVLSLFTLWFDWCFKKRRKLVIEE